MWGVLSDERTGLLFTTAAGPRQRSHSRVESDGNCDHILLSQIRDLNFSSPPTTGRVTVEVFKSVKVKVTLRLTVGQSVSQ
jgi:hypothetical protein